MAHKRFGQQNHPIPGSPDPISFSRRDMLRMGGIALPAATLLQSWFPALSQVVDSFDYYISPNGNDSNPGTLAQPWSITAINTQQAKYAGKRVGLLDGTYNVFPLYSRAANDGYTPLLQIAGGKAGSPTVIQAVNARKAVIQANNGTTYGSNSPVLGTVGASVNGHVTIDGIKLTGHSSKGIYLGDYGVAATTSTRFPGFTVQNCEFTGQNATALAYGNNLSSLEIAGAVGALIQNNYFHDNIGYRLNSADHFSGWLCWFTSGSLWQYNTLISTGGMYGKEHGNFANEIRYNYVDSSTFSGGSGDNGGIADYCDDSLTHHGVSQSWHHNVIKSIDGVDGRSTSSGYFNDVLSIFNNTLIISNSGQSDGFIGKSSPNYPPNIYNNIVYSSATGDHALACWNLNAGGRIDYNLYYSTASSYIWNAFADHNATTRANVGSFSAWKSAIGGDAHSLSGANPLFVATGTGANYYALQAGSPAKNAGKSDGTSGGTTCDMGAWGNNPPARIGCNFLTAQPDSPTLSVA